MVAKESAKVIAKSMEFLREATGCVALELFKSPQSSVENEEYFLVAGYTI